ncbi:MAG: hypothetical protein WDW38_000347 [Sanguina aurantia]
MKHLAQRHKALEEEKKRRADEDAAKLYESFVESFEVEQRAPQQGGGSHDGGFVRGGTVMPGQSPSAPPQAMTSSKKASNKYVPSFMPSSMAEGSKPKAFDDEESVFQPAPKKAEKDKTRNIDKMLEQIKREQEARDARKEGRTTTLDGQPLSLEDSMYGGSVGAGAGSAVYYTGDGGGDPATTNLYVGNLAHDVDEEILKVEFGRFGAIGSVKIMWPRDEEQRAKGRNCGFVAFMRREDAEKAQSQLNGIMLHAVELRIGWGKAVPLPAVPLYVPGLGTSAGALPAASTRPAFADLIVPIKPWETVGGEGEASVHTDGCMFEQLLMEAEQSNADYAFLFDLRCPEHAYYRWRLYSLAEGDTLRTWRVEPFVLVKGGCRWVPPPMTAVQAATLTAAQKGDPPVRERERTLLESERDRFEDMLRGITVERTDITDAMMFALGNADASGEVVDILAQSLSLQETAVPLKVARLFVVSDILHNSTAPVRNASRFRAKLEAVLPEIFESLQATYRSLDSRMTQEVLRKHVLRVLRVWREHYLFNDDYLNGLQATFLQAIPATEPLPDPAEDPPTTSTTTTTSDNPTIKEEATDDTSAPGAPSPRPATDGSSNPTLSAELRLLSDEDLERRCKLAGLVTRGTSAQRVQRLLALDSYLHGDSRQAALAQSASGSMPGGAPPASVSEAAASVKSERAPSMDQQPKAEAQDPSSSSRDAPLSQAAAAAAAAASQTVLQPSSRWTTIDEDEEKQQLPQVPISKWLQQEQQAAEEAAALQQYQQQQEQQQQWQQQQQMLYQQQQHQQQQQQEAMAAAARQQQGDDKIFSDDEDADDDDDGGWKGGLSVLRQRGPSAEVVLDAATPLGGSSASAVVSVMDEERRKRLREVELALARLEGELEDGGSSREEVQARVTERRAELLADLDRAASESASRIARDTAALVEKSKHSRHAAKQAEEDKARQDRGATGGGASGSDSRNGERDRERSSKGSDRDRDSKGGDRDRERDRDSKSKDKSKDKEKEREKEKDRGRSGHEKEERPSGGGGSGREEKERERDSRGARESGVADGRSRASGIDRRLVGMQRKRSSVRSRSRSRSPPAAAAAGRKHEKSSGSAHKDDSSGRRDESSGRKGDESSGRKGDSSKDSKKSRR